MGKRITLVLEHPRMDYVYKRNGNDALDFWASQEGKNYLNYFKGAGIDKKDIDVIYFYPLIPKPLKQRNGRVFSYEKLLANQTSPYMDQLEETIISNDPEIIITTGAMGNKYFTGKGAMKDVRGRPNYHTINGKEYTIFPMYGPTYMSINNNASNMFRADLGTLNKFLDKGQQAFEPEIGNYEYVNTLGRVKEIYNYLLTNKPVVAWDLETNTLEPNLHGSKVLVISMSWEIGQGVTIPVSHKESPFTKEDQETIMSYHKQLMADKEIIKVAHNGRFDIHFLMSTWGFKAFSNTQDTIVAYWLTVSQEVDDSFRLSDLSFYYTNMGDYDRPLEEFKVKYVKDYNDAEAERVKKEKEEQKEILKAYAKENKVTQAEAKTILGLETPVKNKLTNEIDGSNFNYEWIPMDMLAEYASGDTDVTLQIYIALMKQVNEDARWVYLMTDFYPRLIVSLATMQHNGLAVDRNYLKQSLNKYEEDKEYYINIIQENPSVQEVVNEWQDLYEMGLEEYTKPVKERDKDIADLKNKYKKKLDEGFKPSSAKDKQWLLYKVIGVRPPLEKEYLTTSAQNKNFDKEPPTWEDFKTNKETIEWVADNHPEHAEVCNSLLGYIKANTISNTFIKSFLDRINRETSDGLIHGTFNPVGTATSRLSSSSPNIQNLPSNTSNTRRVDYLYPFKRSFVSRFYDGVIVQADYSSLESRVLGLVAQDDVITQGFLDGKDTHKETASIMNGIPYEDVNKTQRQQAKAITFGLLYGKGIGALAHDLDVSADEAQRLMDKYFETKPKVHEFVTQSQERAKVNGYVETRQGNRRQLKDIWNKRKEAESLRQVVNTTIQGTGAYFTNLSVVMIQEYLNKMNKKSKLILTVHDSIVMDCPRDEYQEMVKVMKYVMENLPIPWAQYNLNGETITYPIVADVELGLNYKDAVDADLEMINTFNTLEGYVKFEKDKAKLTDYFDDKRFGDYQNDNGEAKEKYEKAMEIIENSIDNYRNLV